MLRKIKVRSNKIFAYFSLLSMVANTLSPFAAMIPASAYAEDISAPVEVVEEKEPAEELGIESEAVDTGDAADGQDLAKEEISGNEITEEDEGSVPEEEVVMPVGEVVDPEAPDILEDGVMDYNPINDIEEVVEIEEIPTPVEEEVIPEVEEPVQIEYEELSDDVEITDSVKEDWTVDGEVAETKEVVRIGIKYIFPLDEEVTLTFTRLPKDEELRSHLKIERVKVEDLDLPDDFVTDAEYAFDITTDMENGDFEFDLTLPKPEGSEVEVTYIEKSVDEAKQELKDEDIKKVEEDKLEQDEEDDSVKVKDLEHFTIFIVTSPTGPTLSTAMVDGQPYVSVPPITNVTVTLSVTTSGTGDDTDWESSQYSLDGVSWTCVNTRDHTSAGTYEENFTLTAPAVVGSYDLHLRVYNGPNCTGGVSTPNLVLNDAIRVVTPSPSLTPPTLTNNPSDPVALTSVSGIWTDIHGGSGYQGIGTNEIRWGTPAGSQKSGLRFTNSGNQSFDTGETFYLGMLTHMNWPTYSGTAANKATIQITLNFDRPDIPNVVLDYDFDIEETSNSIRDCKIYQRTLTPCDDRVTFPNSYGTQVFTIGDIQYTLVIDGFVDAYPSGNPVDAFITEEQKDNSAFLVGHLSSVLVERPDIRITKKTNGEDITAAPGQNLYVGDTVTWEYIVQNSGNVDLTNVILTDNPAANIDCDPQTEGNQNSGLTLASGADMTCSATGTVVEGQYKNTATVVGTPPTGSGVTAEDSSWYYGIFRGSIKIVKNTNGDDGTFNFTSNFGVDSLTTTAGTAYQTISSLATGSSYSISETVPIGWRLDGAYCDRGTIDAIEVLSNQTTTCTFVNTKLNPALSIVKSGSWIDGDADGHADAGETITYTFSVKNEGNVTLNNVTVTDPKVTVVGGPTTLDVGETDTTTFTASYVITQADVNAGSVYNTATADSNESDSADDKEEVTLPQSPALTIDKEGTFDDGEDNVTNPGDFISYTFVVKNTGNVTLTGITVTDLLPGLSAISCPANTLAVGADMTCTAKYAVTQTDIDAGKVDNTATADSKESGSAEDKEEVTLPQSPALTIDKEGTFDDGEDNVTNPGDFISYTFVVKNTGNVTLTGITVTDPKVSDISCPATTLAVGGSMTCNGTYAVTQADIDAGSVYNIATADSTESEPDTGDNTEELPQDAKIEVVKSGTFGAGDDNLADVGELISYEFLVTNKGNVTLTGITVTDPKVSDISCPATTLAVGGSMTCNGTYAVTQADIDAGSVYNIATADSNESGPATGENTEPLPQNPALSIVKTATPTTYDEVGDVISYSYLVTNSGNITLYDITVKDDKATVTCPDTSEGLAPLAPITCTASYTIGQDDLDDGSVTNSAYATDGTTSSESDDETVNSVAGKIIIEKQTIGGDQGFDFYPSWSEPTFRLSDNQTYPSMWLAPGTYSVTEQTLGDWDLTDIDCIVEGGQSVYRARPSTDTVEIDLSAGETITCTFTNTQLGKIVVEKQTLPNSTSGSFEFNSSWDETNFFLSDGEQKESWLVPETYSFNEIVPTGWSLTNTTCISSIRDIETYENLELDSGETITCVFTNTKIAPPLYVSKFEDLNGNQIREDSERFLDGWTFELYENDTCTGTPSMTSITSGNLGKPGTASFENLYLGQPYWIKEIEQDGWTLTTGNCQSYTMHDDINSNNQMYFGNQPDGSVHGYKWSDYDGDGELDNQEELLSGWTINLYKSNGDGIFEQVNSMVTSSGQEHFGWYWFENLLPGDYKVCEVVESNWIQTFPINDDENCHLISLPSGNSNGFALPSMANAVDGPVYSFGNQELSTVTVYKFHDLNANGTREENEPYLSDWEVNISKFETEGKSQITGFGGSAVFNLLPDSYILSEKMQDGWSQTGIYCEDNKEGDLITSTGEAYGHHGYCEGWNGCGDAETCAQWACEINGYTNLVSYGDDRPCTQFGICHLFNYRGSIQWNWGNWCDVRGVTDIYCSNGNGFVRQIADLVLEGNDYHDNVYNLRLNPGDNKNCYIGNVENSELRVSETNDSWPNTLQIGDTFTYTIQVRTINGPVKNVIMTNLPPKGIEPQAGTFNAVSSERGSLGSTGVAYASPGDWDLGNLKKDEIVTITYKAKVTENIDSGIYPDLSFAQGKGPGGSSVLALSEDSGFAVDGGVVGENFVGTQVKIAADAELETEVDVKEEKIGEVLGASTELPATGADTFWLNLLLVLASIGGLLLLIGGLGAMSTKKEKTMKKGKKVILGLVTLGFFTLFSFKVYAASTVVRLSEPKSPVGDEFDLVFVAMDINDPVRQLTAKCFVQKPGEVDFSSTPFHTETIASSEVGDSRICTVTNSILDQEGQYSFIVKVTPDGGSEVKSNIVSITYDGNGPDKPKYIEKEKVNGCVNKITLKTADDDETTSVQVFADDDKEIDIDDSHKIETENIGSDEKFEFEHTVSGDDCDKTWYYAVVAFDDAGNASKPRSEVITTTTTEETEEETGAIPVEGGAGLTGGEVAGEGAAGPEGMEGGKPVEVNMGEGEEGSVLGEQTGREGKALFKSPWFWIVSAGLGIVIISAVKKSKKD